MLKEFREIAPKGVVDLAIGVAAGITLGTVIGAAFVQIISAVIRDLIYPVLAKFMGGVDFSGTYIMLSGKAPDGASLAEARRLGVTLAIGDLATVLINFIIVVLVFFFILKLLGKIIRVLRRPAPAVLPTDVQLLEEIRDLLAQKSA